MRDNSLYWFILCASAALGNACDGVGECDVYPEHCAPRSVSIQPNTIDYGDINYSFAAYFSAPWPRELSIHGLIVSSSYPLFSKEIVVQQGGSPYLFSLNPARNGIPPGFYSFELSIGTRELTFSRPSLLIRSTVKWQQAVGSPLQFQADVNTSAPAARGVWVGRSASPPQLGEILLLREYVDIASGGLSKSRVSRLGGPTTSWVGASQAEPSSQFALWSFGQASEVPHAVYLPSSGSMYGVSQGVLTTPDVMSTTGNAVSGVKINAMAAVSPKGQPSTIALLMQTNQGLQSYLSTGSGTGMTMPVSLPAEAPPSLTLLAPWADQADGRLAGSGSAGGVLGMEASSGEPVQLEFNGSTFVYNSVKSDILRTALGTGAATAMATGDADGDGKNDIVVARGNVVQVYLQQNNTFVKTAPDLTLPSGVSAAAVAIGQVDGQGKNDLVVADSQERSCGGQPCNHVYVYLGLN